jgi:hypothetical protein
VENSCHGNAAEGFWALWDIYECMCIVITVAMVMLLRDFGPYMILFYIFPSFLTSNLLQLHIRAAEGQSIFSKTLMSSPTVRMSDPTFNYGYQRR